MNTNKEIIDLVLAIFLLSFIFSFNYWSSLNIGLQNLIYVFIPITGVSVLVRVMVRKIYAKKLQLKSTFSLWYFGITLSIILTFLTNGLLVIPLLGSVIVEYSDIGNIGRKKEGITISEISNISLVGLWSNIVLAYIFNIMNIGVGVWINGLLTFFSLIPLPNFDGAYIFTDSIKKWLGTTIASILIFVLPLINDITSLLLTTFLLTITFFVTNYKNI